MFHIKTLDGEAIVWNNTKLKLFQKLKGICVDSVTNTLIAKVYSDNTLQRIILDQISVFINC